MNAPDTKHMQLYSSSNVQYIVSRARALAEQMSPPRALRARHLYALDQLHYCGREGLRSFVENLYQQQQWSDGFEPIVLDIGSGVGGPARFLAAEFGVKLNSVEFLEEFVNAAKELNELCKANIGPSRIRILQGDFTQMDLRQNGLIHAHDFAVSQLCFLHIADKNSLFRNCGEALRNNAPLYCEDFFAVDSIASEESDVLEQCVSVPQDSLLTEFKYRKVLAKHGFEVTLWEDKSSEWSQFIWKRCEKFLTSPTELQKEYGEELFREKSEFYINMAKLFHQDIADIVHRYPQTTQAVGSFWLNRPQCLGGVRYVAVNRGLTGTTSPGEKASSST